VSEQDASRKSGVRGAKEQEVQVDGGKIAAYKVNLMVTFVLADTMDD